MAAAVAPPVVVVAHAHDGPAEVLQPFGGALVALLLGRVVVVRAVDEDRDRVARQVVDEVGSGLARLDGALGVVGQPVAVLGEPVDEPPLQAGVAQLVQPVALLGRGPGRRLRVTTWPS